MAQISATDSRDISVDPLTLEEILTVFNNPINEEQAWAVCHQCAHYFSVETARRTFRDLYTHGIRSVRIKKDGNVIIDATEVVLSKGQQVRRRNSVTGKDIKVVTESDAIQALGVVIYHALDYGLQESEERHLSRDLEHLLEVMINPDEEDDDELQSACDEGIEKDAKEGYSFTDIIVLCSQHLSNEQNISQHYKAVCKALVAEAEELLTFLNRISSGKKQLKKVVQDEDQSRLDELQRSDWARLWVQIMKELRRGVRLKAVEHITTPTEYELTPFEILLDDIKSRRYTLNKVMAKKRILNSPPKVELQPREQILQEIRSQPKLKSVRERRIVETSRTKLNNEDEEECPQPVRKVIKPDFTLFLDSFDESENDNDSSLGSSQSSISSPSPEKDSVRWRRAVVRDVATSDRHCTVERRHSIMVCESPQKKLAHPIECLSLTLEEVTHIRQVLTKAELETLITNHEMYNLVSKGKVCFTCKLVKFSMFGQWGTRCKICKRNVCNNCLRKMNIPTEHFQNIPVHTLSPIPLSPETLDLLKVYERTGSVPHTPSSERKTQQVLEEPATRRTSLQRSHTIGSGSAPTLPNKNLLRGPQMSVCCDCKTMIMEIIRASRTSIALIHKGQEAQPTPTKEEEKGEGLNLSTLSLNIKQFFNK